MVTRIVFVQVFFVLCCSLYAQKADWEKVPVSYTQLPLKPVTPMATKYTMDVIIMNNGMSTNGYYPVVRDGQIMKSDITIAGCQESVTDAQFHVTVQSAGFTITSVASSKSSSTQSGVTKTSYSYTVTFMHKMSYQVFDANRLMLREALVQKTTNTTNITTTAFNSQYELDSWWNVPANKVSFLKQSDDNAYRKAINETKDQLSSELGFVAKNIKISVATAQDAKGYNNADIRQAFQDASQGYGYVGSDDNRAGDFLLKAITAWEKILTEADMENNKARINEHVAGALYENLIYAYCFIQDWDRCNLYLSKLESMDKNGSLKNKLQDAQAFKTDYETRIKANKTF